MAEIEKALKLKLNMAKIKLSAACGKRQRMIQQKNLMKGKSTQELDLSQINAEIIAAEENVKNIETQVERIRMVSKQTFFIDKFYKNNKVINFLCNNLAP